MSIAPKGICLVIYAYGDDGSDSKRERVISVAIIAGREEWWEEAEVDWKVRCGGIPFHATDCESDQGDYENIPHEQNKALYKDLTRILAASKLGGIGVGIDLQGQQKVFPGRFELSYYRAFSECMEKVANVAEKDGEVVKIVFDVSRENEYNASALYSMLRNGEPRFAQRLDAEIGFTTWRGCPRVQMADLLAFESWKAIDHTLGPIKRTRKSWDVLRGTNRFETLAYGEEWFLGLKAHIGELEKAAGFNEGDYLQWLSNKNRKHNISNLIAFIDSRSRERKK